MCVAAVAARRWQLPLSLIYVGPLRLIIIWLSGEVKEGKGRKFVMTSVARKGNCVPLRNSCHTEGDNIILIIKKGRRWCGERDRYGKKILRKAK